MRGDLGEGVAGDVLLHDPSRDDQRARDGGVRAALRHEREDFSFPWRERGQGVRATAGPEKLADYFRVEYGAPLRDPGDRVDEVADVGDALSGLPLTC
jgi:hypothetical protein